MRPSAPACRRAHAAAADAASGAVSRRLPVCSGVSKAHTALRGSQKGGSEPNKKNMEVPQQKMKQMLGALNATQASIETTSQFFIFYHKDAK